MTKGVNRKTSALRALAIGTLVLLWLGLAGAGFWYARQYVQQTVREIQETNALHVQALEEEIHALRGEMQRIEEALAAADRTLAGTSSASEEVNERISQLDQQLKKLEKSLNILQESSNVDY